MNTFQQLLVCLFVYYSFASFVEHVVASFRIFLLIHPMTKFHVIFIALISQFEDFKLPWPSINRLGYLSLPKLGIKTIQEYGVCFYISLSQGCHPSESGAVRRATVSRKLSLITSRWHPLGPRNAIAQVQEAGRVVEQPDPLLLLPLLCHLVPEICQLGGEGLDQVLGGLQLVVEGPPLILLTLHLFDR